MKTFFMILLYFVVFCSNVFAVTLTIPEKVSVESEKNIKLGDIAEFDSKPDLISEIIVHEKIEPGKKSYLYKKKLESILKKYGVLDFKVYMENRVELNALFYEFGEEDAKKIILEYLSKNNENIKFDLKKLFLIGNRKFASRDFDLLDVKFLSEELSPGNNRGEIRIYSNGNESVIKFLASFTLDVEIVCASKDLPRDKILAPDDLEIKSFRLEMEKGDYFTDEKFLLGKKLRKNYYKGEIITSAMTYRPSLIHRGDEVQIAAVSDGIFIVTRGEALRDGHIGDMIPVRNLKSGKEVRGEIISSNSVRVSF
ncbi:MAG: flagellar basal body P-ring formation protein FlgA [Desulfobacteraceae bacterium]|nr:flagellar basal body P-ring formation protein FlgA [Desulfobacteraceae bacterium]